MQNTTKLFASTQGTGFKTKQEFCPKASGNSQAIFIIEKIVPDNTL